MTPVGEASVAVPLTGAERRSLSAVRTIELTTYGRRSGQPSRIEIWWFTFEDRFIVSGTPGRRDWLANIGADSRVVVHANGSSFSGNAVAVTDQQMRRRFFRSDVTEVRWYTSQAELETLVAQAPMIEITFD